MATYTTELRVISESGYPLFDFSYPIWDENYRSVLNEKILKRYYFREIGFETVGLFKWFLNERLNSIMPKYIAMWNAKVEYELQNAYRNKDITITKLQITDVEGERLNSSTGSQSARSESNDSGSTDSKDVFHDTPMSELGVPDASHASRIEVNEVSTSNTGLSNTSGTMSESGTNKEEVKTVDDYLERMFGFDGMKYAFEVYQGVRENIIVIDNMILSELKDLFMGVY